MEGLEIGKSSGGLAAALSSLAATASVAAGIWIGPEGVYIASGLGLAMAVIALAQAGRLPAPRRSLGYPALLLGSHAVLLIIGLALQSMFLTPLPAGAAKMPRLQTPYEDPDGIFSLRGPVEWTYRAAPSKLESGVRLQPANQGRYMGVSEATVYVRRLDTAPGSPREFLENAASAFSDGQRGGGRRLFELHTESGTALSGAPVMWSSITIRKFWVPLYQLSLFGVKDGRYLCSVSATGLSSHSALARLLCLGLFERIVITDRR